MEVNVSIISKYISFISEKSTEKIVDLSQKMGLNTTSRWASLVVLFIAGLILYIGLKISQPIIKILLIILAGLIILGIFWPFWIILPIV